MMREIFLCAAATALFAGCATSNTASKETLNQKRAEILMMAATESLENKDYGGALRSLLEASRFDPKNPSIQSNLGIVFAHREDLARAEEHWMKALQLDPKHYDSYLNLGILYRRGKRYPEAERMFLSAGKDPAYEKLHLVAFNLAVLYLELGQPFKAEDQLKVTVRENPGFCAAWLRLGRMQRERGDYTEATRSLRQAVMGTCYKNPEAHYEIASLYLKTSDTPQAKSKLLEIIQLFPQSEWAKKSEATLNMIR